MASLKIKKLSPDAIIPTRGSAGAVGYDLYSIEDTTVPSSLLRFNMVKTGIAIQLPEGTYGRVAPRSGLTCKKQINVGAGVIDRDYTGEIMVCLFNNGGMNFDIKKGDRIAQLIIERCETPEVEEVEELDTTDRGEGGFGSTGN